MNLQELLNLALQCYNTDDLAGAEALYRQVLARQFNQPNALHMLGLIASRLGRPDAALHLIEQAIAAYPNAAEFHFNHGILLAAFSRQSDALAAYQRSLNLDPASVRACRGIGSTLRDLGRPRESKAAFRHAQKLAPNDPSILEGLGNASHETGDWNAAIDFLTQSISLRPENPSAHLSLGMVLLANGDFEHGWREFEYRWQTRELARRQSALGKPLWDGADLSGRRILLHAERGAGDTFNFIRYVLLVAQRGGKVFLTVQPELSDLVKQISGINPCIQSVPPGQPLPDFDVHCSLVSLPAVMKTTLSTIPAANPYLLADADLSARWKSRVPSDNRLKIGLVCTGNSYLPKRSIPPELLSPLASIPNLWFCSLQKVPSNPLPFPIENWSNDLGGFSDTAALIDNLDLVITIDTSVAHLAGAMGKQTWLLLKFVPDWRWLTGRADSPWYPTMRLFRQSRLDDWLAPIAELAAALRSFITSRA